MIGITERAKRELKELLFKKSDMPQARLRLTGNRKNLGMGVDIELPGDEIVEYQGKKILVVERRLAVSLKGIVLDVDDTPQGPQLVIDEAS
jgi:Fe-S cluster assembly iron-binding protein IscA